MTTDYKPVRSIHADNLARRVLRVAASNMYNSIRLLLEEYSPCQA